MFKKPIRVKTSNRMKGSERKRLKQNILKQFTQLSEEKLNEIMPNKDDTFITKIETANEICITCYCLNKNPMFFEIEKENVLIPTVYALWKHVQMTQYMVTAPFVFEKISKGADLMLPGVLLPYGGFDDVKKGQIVAIRLAGNSSPVAVGTATMSTSEMLACGMRGKGIQVSHWYMDNLWALGDGAELPILPDSPINKPIEEDDHVNDNSTANQASLQSAMKNLGLTSENVNNTENNESGTSEREDEKESRNGDENENENEDFSHQNEDIVAEVQNENSEDELQLSPEEQMDQLLENCFYQSLIEAKKIELPVLVTTFSAQYLHPSCPDGQKIDLKKSKYKKMSKFLQEMESRGLVKVAELSKGVLSITEINLEHSSVREFKASSFAKEKSMARAEAQSKKEEQNSQEGMFIVELFGVSGKTQVFFKLFDKSKGDALSASEVRELLKSYVKVNELVNQRDKRKVTLDPLLSDILFDKNFQEEVVTWEVLMSRFLEKMNPCHKTVINGKESKVKKGKAEPIEVKIEQRMGNKKVTLVRNLEQFGIDPNDFAHRIQLAAASSTTVNPLPGKNLTGQQVLIQGNQTNHVAKVLDELKVPKKYITGLDKIKSKNKKR